MGAQGELPVFRFTGVFLLFNVIIGIVLYFIGSQYGDAPAEIAEAVSHQPLGRLSRTVAHLRHCRLAFGVGATKPPCRAGRIKRPDPNLDAGNRSP